MIEACINIVFYYYCCRFGSFEIVKNLDLMTGRRGPSAGRKDILIQLLDYVIKTFYPQVCVCFFLINYTPDFFPFFLSKN